MWVGHGAVLYCLTHLCPSHLPYPLPPHREDQVLRERAEAWSKVEQMAKENPKVGHHSHSAATGLTQSPSFRLVRWCLPQPSQ